MKKILILALAFGVICSVQVIQQSYGHGLGTEILPPVDIGSKKVSLEATAIPFDNPEINGRQIEFALVDANTRVTIRDVTFLLKIMQGDDLILEHTFQKHDGILIVDLLPSESDQITIEEESEVSTFELLIGVQSKSTATGAAFKKGGLYLFEVQILTVDSYSNTLEEPVVYNFGLSYPEVTFHEVNDPNFGKQELEFIAYYDQLSSFNYDPDTKVINFELPFEWTEDNIEQSTVVHNEIRFSKEFGDLLVPGYSVYVNTVEMPEHVATIDGFSEFNRIVHFIIPKQDLYDLNSKIPFRNNMQFTIIPDRSDWYASTVTANGQFKINLGFENDIKSGKTNKFTFDILDVFFKDKPISVPYEVSFVHNGNVIEKKDGISTDVKGIHNNVEFMIPNEISGPVTLQFDNLDGNSLARVGIPVIVNRVDSDFVQPNTRVSIPDWVRNNAGWWAAGDIGDSDFATGIEFMIKEGIIQVPATEQQEGSESVIPDWIRNNADWWSQGLISDNDFAGGLQFLIANGIISV